MFLGQGRQVQRRKWQQKAFRERRYGVAGDGITKPVRVTEGQFLDHEATQWAAETQEQAVTNAIRHGRIRTVKVDEQGQEKKGWWRQWRQRRG